MHSKPPMINTMENMLALQRLHFDPRAKASTSPAEIEALRGSVPPPILAHFDRMLARGKKGVAIVRNGVCTGCHLRLTSGTNADLLNRAEIHVCDSCGRYLYLPEPEPEAAAPAPVKKVTRTRRKAVAVAHAV